VLAQLAAKRLHLSQRLLPLDDLVEQDLQPLDIRPASSGSRTRLPSSPSTAVSTVALRRQ
jgi:hypothetical protein